MRFLLAVCLFASQEATINKTTGVQDLARLEAFIKLYFELVEVPFPERIEVHVIPYEQFEEQLAQQNAGPQWQQWLRVYRAGDNLTMSAFISVPHMYDNELVVTAWQLSDNDLAHEFSHYACHRIGSKVGMGLHRAPITDCVNAITSNFWHSKSYRAWLRERPWLR